MEVGLPSLGVAERRVLAWERSEGERKASVLLVLQRIGLATVVKRDKGSSISSVIGRSISPRKTNTKTTQAYKCFTGSNSTPPNCCADMVSTVVV